MVTETTQTWSGRSDEIAVPLLGAEFWKEGTEISGTFDGVREQKVGGPAYKLVLDTPLTLEGEEESVIEIPSLTGFRYALQALKMHGYQGRRGDLWSVRCCDIKASKKEGFSDSPQFEVNVIRRAAAAA